MSGKLFPYLHGFRQKATGPNTIEYKIGEIFGKIKNKIQSSYNLREIIDHIDELHFRSQTEKHELSHLYEAKIKNMGNAGRNGGEYYTPRPLIRVIVEVVNPHIGERIYDGAVGAAGFLCEAFDYLRHRHGDGRGRRAPSCPTPDELWKLTFAKVNAWRDRLAAVPYPDIRAAHGRSVSTRRSPLIACWRRLQTAGTECY